MSLEDSKNVIKDILINLSTQETRFKDNNIKERYYVSDKDIQKRYQFNGDMRVLAARVVSYLAGHAPVEYLEKFYEEIAERRFIPAGNTLVIGKVPLQPNCSIIGSVCEQSYDEVEARCRVLWANRIGVGFDLSNAEDPVGILMKLSKANHNVDVGDWRPKRGNIATLSVEHPRLLEFVRCKSDSESQANQLYNFNISVALTDKFMSAVKQGDVNATNTLSSISQHAHAYGDPGLVFIDRVQDGHEPIVTAVPCGEQFMHNDETCNLGSVNLDAFVKDDIFDIVEFKKTVQLATRFLDIMVDLLEIPDESMAARTKELRRVGLGVMGFATTLKSLDIPYESESALRFGAFLANALTSSAREASIMRAEEAGEGYLWDNLRRNISVTCVAPTGGIRRLVANDGYAIEPLFTEKRPSPEFEVRMVGTWQRYIENAISKTIILPNDATSRQIYNLFLLSYQEGCKGITVYRDSYRSNQPIKVCDGDSCEIVQNKK